LWKHNHYRENKEEYLSKQARRRAEVKKYIDGFKIKGCSICGYNKCVGALDFHHVSEKGDGLNRASQDKWSKSRIDAEVAKCILICANCHRELHYQ